MEAEGEKKEQTSPVVGAVSQEPVVQTLLLGTNNIMQKSEMP